MGKFGLGLRVKFEGGDRRVVEGEWLKGLECGKKEGRVTGEEKALGEIKGRDRSWDWERLCV